MSKEKECWMKIKEGQSQTSETTQLSTNWRNPLFPSKLCLHYICQKWQLQNLQETSWNQTRISLLQLEKGQTQASFSQQLRKHVQPVWNQFTQWKEWQLINSFFTKPVSAANTAKRNWVFKATHLSMGNSTVFSTISSFSEGRATMTRASAVNSIKTVGYRGMTRRSFRATEQVYWL